MSDDDDTVEEPADEPQAEEPQPETEADPEPSEAYVNGGEVDSPTPNAHVVGVTIVEDAEG